MGRAEQKTGWWPRVCVDREGCPKKERVSKGNLTNRQCRPYMTLRGVSNNYRELWPVERASCGHEGEKIFT